MLHSLMPLKEEVGGGKREDSNPEPEKRDESVVINANQASPSSMSHVAILNI